VDKQSHFDADIKISSNYHSDLLYADISNPDFQIISATENNAYDNVKMHRTTAMIKIPEIEFPFAIDIFRVKSDSAHQLDFPFYYRGQMVSTDFKIQKNTSELKTLGSKNGYQHLWLEGCGKSGKNCAAFTWVNDNRFYTITTLCNASTELLFTRTGAADPDFNLRYEPCFMLRQPQVKQHTFVSVIEPHGLYDLNKEVTVDYKSSVSAVEIIQDNDELTAIKLTIGNGKVYILVVANNIKSSDKTFDYQNNKIKLSDNYYFSSVSH
jgi:hypothetical protein